ncbi:MAG: TetR/AcrR family transcriptional regulator [Oleiphilus sp.]
MLDYFQIDAQQDDTLASKTYHHGDLKEALLAASHKILREKGADSLSLRAVAAEVGVSHMAPYSHFKSKKSLFQEVAASGFDELASTMVKNSKGLSEPAELILSYGATYIEFALAKPQLYRLMLGQVENAGRRIPDKTDSNTEQNKGKATSKSSEHSLSPELQRTSKRPFDLLETAFAQTSRNETKVKAQALGAWSMVHGMAALLIEGHFEIPPSMTTKDFLAMAAVYKPV